MLDSSQLLGEEVGQVALWGNVLNVDAAKVLLLLGVAVLDSYVLDSGFGGARAQEVREGLESSVT